METDRKILMTDRGYPRRLLEIPQAPKQLYVRGRLPEEGVPSVAIIGARDCSYYGQEVAKRLGRLFGENGIQVISGMARGIDGIGQQAALQAGGSSFAVLGCGADICYPRQNQDLYDRLCKQGGVISEYEWGTPPRAGNFPPRNRIVSGLADAVIVVEARKKSGTLITVDMALEQGKEVYAVPGRLVDDLSSGCNYLIKNGAGILLDMEEFMEELWKQYRMKRGGMLQVGSRRTEDKKIGKRKAENKPGGVEQIDSLRIKRVRELSRGMGGEAGKKAEMYEEIYMALEENPLSVEEIEQRLVWQQEQRRREKGEEESAENREERLITSCLMRLCMEGFAVQVSPGYFARKGRD